MENNYSAILEDNIERRRMNDKPLINFWLWVGVYIGGVVITTIISMLIMAVSPKLDLSSFLGTLLGFGIGASMIYLQTERVNAFIVRKTEWYKTIVEFTDQHSEDSRNLKKLNNLINPEIFNVRIRPINLQNSLISLSAYSLSTYALISSIGNVDKLIPMMITVVGLSVVFFIIYEYPMNALWNKLQMFENEFDETLSEVWKEKAWIEKPIKFHIDPSKDRNFFLWLFYSTVSLGIMIIIWNYKKYTDPDNMYYRFHEKEDKILDVIEKIEQKHSQQKISEIENQK